MDSANSPNASTSTATVQHVTKKSSDELLRKFAEVGHANEEGKKELRLVKRRKRSSSSRRIATRREGEYRESPNNNGSIVERKWLLPPAATRRSALLRHLGIGRSQLRARDVRNRSLFGTIEKTWRKTVEGASRVFMEKHYNGHKRLINDVV
ncbi:ABC transporter ATP-binding/permease protein like [Melia azedarach]|uniref:ABC transporter ATP-binding/permease protein like n=1 Tax=Melia azedarach TaxID=155640 RepID=A0ACC1X2Y6_MELAZ|nr:ABC transporter ATP-binding/permease protein like [Melia azedarach]